MFGRGVAFSIRTKLTLLFIALILAPFLLSGLVTYHFYTTKQKDNIRQYSEQIMSQLAVNLDFFFEDLEELTLMPFYDTELQAILEQYENRAPGEFMSRNDFQSLAMFLHSLIQGHPEIHGAYIVLNDSGYITPQSMYIERPQGGDPEPVWLSRAKAADGLFVIVPPHESHFYGVRPERVFAVARAIRSITTDQHLGFIKLDLKPSAFDKVISTVQLTPGSRLTIMDPEGNALYPDLHLASEAGNAESGGQNDLVLFSRSEDYGLQIEAALPLADLTREARELTGFTLAISAASLVLAFVLAAVASNMFLRPVRDLHRLMRRVQLGSFDVQAPVRSNDEMGGLAQGFNSMIRHIQHLVKEVYETKLRERDAEIAALQSQINPHFLYNTLEQINMMAIRKNQWDLSRTVSTLGRLLNYTIDHKEKMVSLADEIRFVEGYLLIQNMRLNNVLDVRIDVEPELAETIVPKLILQPLVENAIVHGLSHEGGVIELTVRREGDDLVLSVADEGKGMAPEDLEQLALKIYSRTEAGDQLFAEKKRGGHALRNVHHRVRLLYGEPYGLFIDGRRERGMRFVIRLPHRHPTEEGDRHAERHAGGG